MLVTLLFEVKAADAWRQSSPVLVYAARLVWFHARPQPAVAMVSVPGYRRLSATIGDDVRVTPPDEPGGNESDVFAGLPRTRPQRPSARRKAPVAKAVAKKPPVSRKPPAAKKPAAKKKTAPAKPRAKASNPPIPRSGYATPEPTRPTGAADAIGDAVQAVAELARSILGRLPKP